MINTQTKKYISSGVLSLMLGANLLSTTTLADDYSYVKATHLNVRADANVRSSIVATVDTGYKVTVLETLENGWRKVLLANGETGYVNGKFLVDTEPYFEKALGSNYVVAAPRAFVRAEGLEKKIAVLHKGDRLEILDEKVFLGKWLRVRVVSAEIARYNDRVGYIAKQLATVDETTAYPVEAPVDTTSTDASGTTDVGLDIPLNSAPAADDSWISDSTPAASSTTSTTNSAVDVLNGMTSAPAATSSTPAPSTTSASTSSGADDISGLLNMFK